MRKKYILWMVLLVFKGIALVADLAAKFCCTLHTSAHHYSLMYDSEMKHTLVMDREVYNAHWWGFIFLKDMFVFLSLRCFSQMIFLERFSSLLIFPSPSTLILAISNIKVFFSCQEKTGLNLVQFFWPLTKEISKSTSCFCAPQNKMTILIGDPFKVS